MKPARLAIIGVALVAGLAAAYLASSSKPPEAPPPAPAPAIATDDVLVATRELSFGSILLPADMRWEIWPKANVPDGVIRKSVAPNAVVELGGSVIRSNFAEGEPFRRERLIKGSNSNFMAAVLSPGMRAVAINIEANGATTPADSSCRTTMSTF